jgi:hypothetical protein
VFFDLDTLQSSHVIKGAGAELELAALEEPLARSILFFTVLLRL